MKSPSAFDHRIRSIGNTQRFYLSGLLIVVFLIGCQNKSPIDATVSEAVESANPIAAVEQQSMTESQKIDFLIQAVAALDGASFVRNGTSYSAADAASHLRQKLGSAGSWAETASDFIENIASKSSITGAEYEIRFEDGRVVTAGEFLRRELSKVQQ